MDYAGDLLHDGGVEKSVVPMAAQVNPETGFVAKLDFLIVLLEFNQIGILVRHALRDLSPLPFIVVKITPITGHGFGGIHPPMYLE